ncbi:MAG: UPF0280 family protein [Euryarchaeota archaeon]|nr:UPF0280 family protein [Euryarchaeota archaeon]
MELYREELIHRESRIKLIVDDEFLAEKAYDELLTLRAEIEEYIGENPLFKTSLRPYSVTEDAPEIVKRMAEGAEIANVGPMAAVAGTIAEFLCRRIIEKGASTAIVEKGGDIFACTEKPIIIGLFSGSKKLANTLAFTLNKENTPLAICSSSSFLGHSLSFGGCDLATIFSPKAAVADAVATAVGNMVSDERDVAPALEWAVSRESVDGAMILKDEKLGMIGEIPSLIRTNDTKVKEKITKDGIYRL